MFLKCGCGCVVLVVESQNGFEKENWIVRMFDYCGESDGIAIGGPERLGARILPRNVETARFLSPDEYAPYLDQLRDLVVDGYRFRTIKAAMKPLVGE